MKLSPLPLAAFAAAGAFLAILISRLLIIHSFATDLPFWDQWDAEGLLLLRPFQNGDLSWATLVSAHNEHRVLFTRIVTLLLFVLNDGQWDNMVSLAFNATMYALLFCAIVYTILHSLRWRTYWPLLVLCILVACLPFAAENFLSGFQNQFCFMIVFTLTGIWLAASRRPSPAWLIALCLLAVASVFTVASGLLSGPGFAAAALLRWSRNDPDKQQSNSSPRAPPSFGGLLAGLTLLTLLICAIAFWTMPDVPGHAVMRAQSLGDFCDAAITIFSWPMFGRWWCVLLIWTPYFLGAHRILRRRAADAAEIAAVALGAWVIAQALAMAFSRGHAMVDVSSRYTDILALGMLVNAFMTIRTWSVGQARHGTSTFALASLLTVYFGALAYKSEGGLTELRDRNALSQLEIAHVRQFVAKGDLAELQNKPRLHIPYPDAEKLGMMLSDSTIRAMLPASVRPSIILPRSKAFVSDGFYPTTTGNHLASTLGSYNTEEAGDRNQGEVLSAYVSSQFPYLGVDVAGYLGTPGLELTLESAGPPRRSLPIQPSAPARESWVRLFVPVPDSTFQLHASDQRPDSWFAFSEPVEMGRLSALVARSLEDIWYVADAFLLLLFFASIAAWYRTSMPDNNAGVHERAF